MSDRHLQTNCISFCIHVSFVSLSLSLYPLIPTFLFLLYLLLFTCFCLFSTLPRLLLPLLHPAPHFSSAPSHTALLHVSESNPSDLIRIQSEGASLHGVCHVLVSSCCGAETRQRRGNRQSSNRDPASHRSLTLSVWYSWSVREL